MSKTTRFADCIAHSYPADVYTWETLGTVRRSNHDTPTNSQPSQTTHLRLSLSKLSTHIQHLLQHRHHLQDRDITLKFFGDPDWRNKLPTLDPQFTTESVDYLPRLDPDFSSQLNPHNDLPKLSPDLLLQLQAFINEDDAGLPANGRAELNDDLKGGTPESVIAVIFLIVMRHALRVDFRITKSFLHYFPIFASLFDEPKVYHRQDELECAHSKGFAGVATWCRPVAWSRSYWPSILETIGEKLRGLKLDVTWSMGERVAYPPFSTMIPVSRLPLPNLKRLLLPYFAVIPRIHEHVSPFSTSELPAGLEELIIVQAYPSRLLFEWLRGVCADMRRLRQLRVIEVRFDDRSLRSYKGFAREGLRLGGIMSYCPPVFLIERFFSG
jgi:hypothetical protein